MLVEQGYFFSISIGCQPTVTQKLNIRANLMPAPYRNVLIVPATMNLSA